MPYVDEKSRIRIECGGIPRNAGELNYKITRIINGYTFMKGESYQTYNDILGVLSAIPQELYRRKIASYEDKKIKENGDVY